MDEVEKLKRLLNPTCVADYHLGVNLAELVKTDEGRKLYDAEIMPWMPYDPTAPKPPTP